MQQSEYKNIFENESTHFYYVANHEIILSLVRKYKPERSLKILDAGCGTGLLAKKLQNFGKVWGVDISPNAIKYAKKRSVNAKLGSINKLPYASNTFDVVTSLDVIYHKQVDDQKALSELYRVLKKGGVLILRAPANKWLTSAHDRAVHTRERYTTRGLSHKLKKAKFEILKLSYVNSALLPFAALTLIIEKIKKETAKSGVSSLPKPINQILTSLLMIDLYLLQKMNLPFGLGVITVAKKSGDKISTGKQSS